MCRLTESLDLSPASASYIDVVSCVYPSQLGVIAPGKENSPQVPTKTRKQLSRMLTSPKAASTSSSSSTLAMSVLFSPPNKEKILKKMTADKLTATQRCVLEMVRLFYDCGAVRAGFFLSY